MIKHACTGTCVYTHTFPQKRQTFAPWAQTVSFWLGAQFSLAARETQWDLGRPIPWKLMQPRRPSRRETAPDFFFIWCTFTVILMKKQTKISSFFSDLGLSWVKGKNHCTHLSHGDFYLCLSPLQAVSRHLGPGPFHGARSHATSWHISPSQQGIWREGCGDCWMR